MFKLHDADPTDLVFFLRDENENTEVDEAVRHKLRRKYWAYALQIIKEVHGESGTFCNVNPSKDNWISVFVGISGFSNNCIANYDLARVDLYLGKPEKEENKKSYDVLTRHKNEIEEKLGVSLIWNRADDIKLSKISYQLNGVSIENEADWFHMAKFHAEWSKKFCDVIVPYLR